MNDAHPYRTSSEPPVPTSVSVAAVAAAIPTTGGLSRQRRRAAGRHEYKAERRELNGHIDALEPRVPAQIVAVLRRHDDVSQPMLESIVGATSRLNRRAVRKLEHDARSANRRLRAHGWARARGYRVDVVDLLQRRLRDAVDAADPAVREALASRVQDELEALNAESSEPFFGGG